MIQYVFRPKRNGCIQKSYRGRYSIGETPRLYDIALRTQSKEVAELRLKEIAEEKEQELAGLIAPRGVREGARTLILSHLDDFLGYLVKQGRAQDYIKKIRSRVPRLCRECRWEYPPDVTADSFRKWCLQREMAPKTLNHYLDSISSLFNWMLSYNRVDRNPLKYVKKVSNSERENEAPRAFTLVELERLFAIAPYYRRVAYQAFYYTGLRRKELRALEWDDLHFDEGHIQLRARTTKSRRGDLIPLHPELANILLEFRRGTGRAELKKIFYKGVPLAKSLKADAEKAGLSVVDDWGRELSIHTFRRTFDTQLQLAGASPLAVQKLMRHKDIKLTAKTYFDAEQLGLQRELVKIPNPLSSHIASQNSGHNGKGLSQFVQREITEKEKSSSKVVDIEEIRTLLSKIVQNVPNGELVLRGGLEPPHLSAYAPQAHVSTNSTT